MSAKEGLKAFLVKEGKIENDTTANKHSFDLLDSPLSALAVFKALVKIANGGEVQKSEEVTASSPGLGIVEKIRVPTTLADRLTEEEAGGVLTILENAVLAQKAAKEELAAVKGIAGTDFLYDGGKGSFITYPLSQELRGIRLADSLNKVLGAKLFDQDGGEVSLKRAKQPGLVAAAVTAKMDGIDISLAFSDPKAFVDANPAPPARPSAGGRGGAGGGRRPG